MGLRERKRAQTRHRLEEAAIGLALRDGLDKVTIDAISERADVSPRTFFNYFDSKEDAILGVRPPDISEQTLAEHRVRYDGVGSGRVGHRVADPGRSARRSTNRRFARPGWRSCASSHSCSSG